MICKLTHEKSDHAHTHARAHTRNCIWDNTVTPEYYRVVVYIKGKEVRQFNDIISWCRLGAAQR